MKKKKKKFPPSQSSTVIRSQAQVKPAPLLIPIDFFLLILSMEEFNGTRCQGGPFSLINVGCHAELVAWTNQGEWFSTACVRYSFSSFPHANIHPCKHSSLFYPCFIHANVHPCFIPVSSLCSSLFIPVLSMQVLIPLLSFPSTSDCSTFQDPPSSLQAVIPALFSPSTSPDCSIF